MSNEIELKLSVQPAFGAFLSQEMSNFSVRHQQKQFLANCYYDTEDRFFARQKMGLRVRQKKGQFTLTLKTDGNVHGGLHSRPEYNVALKDAQPDLHVLVEQTGLALGEISGLQLVPIFTTDFTRQCWLVACGNDTLIEVAFDVGQICAGQKTEPICEVEFELKAGDTKDLLRFVYGLSLEQGVRLSASSKAQRGYQLAHSQGIKPADWLEKWREFLKVEQQMQDSLQKLTALFAFEQALMEESFALGQAYFALDFLGTVQRISAFFNLYHYYTEHPQLLQSVFQGHPQTLFDEQDSIGLIEQHQILLREIKAIVRLHSETQHNAVALNHLFELLQTGQFVKRMLHLMALTMEK